MLFRFLFTTDIPDEVRFQSFTLPHLALVCLTGYLVARIAATARKRGAAERSRILRRYTLALPAMYLIQLAVFALLEAYVEPQVSRLDRLPLQLCTMNAIVMPLGVFTRNNTLLNYIYGICLPGAAAALLTPAMSYYGKYAFFSWQVVFFFLNHGLMVLVAVLTVACGYLRPGIRKLPRVLGIFALYALCIYPLNRALDANFLFLNHPDEGTVMAFLAKDWGNPGYLIPLGGLAVLLVFAMFLPWAIGDRMAKRRGEPS